jgi:hypothetical protein
MVSERSVWSCLTCSAMCDSSATATATATSDPITTPPTTTAPSGYSDTAPFDDSDYAYFDDHADMCGTLKNLGFRRYHMQRDAKKRIISYSWKCACKCVLRCATFFITVIISFRERTGKGGCNVRIHTKLVEDNLWSTPSMVAATSHTCSSTESAGTQPLLLKKTYQLSKYTGLLSKIQELGATRAFTPKDIQTHIQSLQEFSGALVDTSLIQRIGNKAREEVFGPGCSDTGHLIAKQKDIVAAGGAYDLIYDKTDKEKLIGIIWVAPYCHLLIPHFADCFGSDGTHGMSK